jgi:hypothetical protein
MIDVGFVEQLFHQGKILVLRQRAIIVLHTPPQVLWADGQLSYGENNTKDALGILWELVSSRAPPCSIARPSLV